MNKKTIIIDIISVIIIVVGIIITCICGLNYDLLYNNHKEIDIYIGKEFDNKEIQEIVKEVIDGEKVIIKKVELYEDMTSIVVKDITDEQLETINTKINEKFEIENSVEDFSVSNVSKVKMIDLIRPYILGTILSFVIVMVYLFIYMKAYKKIVKNMEICKGMLQIFISIVVIQLLYFSIISITRIPVTRLTIPIAILLYIATIIVNLYALENYNKNSKQK